MAVFDPKPAKLAFPVPMIAGRVRCQSASESSTLRTTWLGRGYHRRLVSISFIPSIKTLNSPSPPLIVCTCRSGSFLSWAATRAAIALLMGHTGQ